MEENLKDKEYELTVGGPAVNGSLKIKNSNNMEAVFTNYGAILVSLFEDNLTIGIVGSAATLGNVGPGFGAIGPFENFAELTPLTKLIFTFNMLVGRLELIPFLAMLHSDFWKFSFKKEQ